MKRTQATGFVVAAVIVAVATGGLAMPTLLASHSHTITVSFPTADGLLAGSDVLEAGARVGSVDTIEPQTNNTAMVTLRIDDANWPLHSGVAAAVRPKSLLGEKYVAITDGPANNAAYDASRPLVETQQAVPVELDQFINSLDPPTRAAAQTLLNDLGAGVAGRGPDINVGLQSARADLANLATTGQTLNNRDPISIASSSHSIRCSTP